MTQTGGVMEYKRIFELFRAAEWIQTHRQQPLKAGNEINRKTNV